MTSRLNHGSQLALLTAGRLVSAALSVALMVVVARFLPITDVGQLGLLLSLALVFGMATDFGLSVVLQEHVAAHPMSARSTVVRVLRRRALLSIPGCVGFLLAYALLSPDPSVAAGVTMAIAVLGMSIYTTCTAGLRAGGHVPTEVFGDVASRALAVFAALVLLALGGGLVSVAAAYALAVWVFAGWALVRVHHLLAASERSPMRTWELHRLVPIGVSAFLFVAYGRIEIWVIARFADAVALGQYSAAARVAEGISIPALAVAALVVARVAGLPVHRAHTELRELSRSAVAFTVLPAFFVVVFAEPILTIAFGSEYAASSAALRVLALAAIAGSVGVVAYQFVALTRPRCLLATMVGLIGARVVVAISFTKAIDPMTGAAASSLVCAIAFSASMVLAAARPASARGYGGLADDSSPLGARPQDE